VIESDAAAGDEIAARQMKSATAAQRDAARGALNPAENLFRVFWNDLIFESFVVIRN